MFFFFILLLEKCQMCILSLFKQSHYFNLIIHWVFTSTCAYNLSVLCLIPPLSLPVYYEITMIDICCLKCEFLQQGNFVTSCGFKQVDTKQVCQVACNEQEVYTLNTAFSLMLNCSINWIGAEKKCGLFSSCIELENGRNASSTLESHL